MRRNSGKALALVLLLAACGPQRPDGNNGPDASPGGGDGGNTGGDSGLPTGDGCPDESKLIYTIDQNRTLLQFNPMTKTFNSLGTLSCGTPPTTASPFSMAIARDATAWVLYNDGELYRVDTKNALACTKSSWVTTNGLRLFGMGFSTDQVGGTADTLFIAGGSGPSPSASATLTKLDLSTFQPATVGTVAGWPELTGTGGAELWGFFPQTTTMNARIAKLDKTTGAALQTFQETVLNDTETPPRQPQAWAFAFHGGSFWVFLQKVSDPETFVYQFNASTGAMVGKTDSGGRKIVGAGVSTCAPIIL